MKVYFFILYSFPFGMAASKRIHCYATGLNAAGNDCKVIICNRTETESSNDELPEKGIYKGVKYEYINGKIKYKSKWFEKIITNSIDYIKTFIYVLRNVKKNEIIFCYYYNLIFDIILILCSKIKGAKIVRELGENPSVIRSNNRINKLLNWIEFKIIFRHFDGFIPISIELQNLAEKYKSKHAKTILIPILVENNQIDIRNIELDIKLPNPYIIHTGTMYEEKDGITDILKAFSLAIKSISYPIYLVFAGPDSIIPNKFDSLINKLNLSDNIILLGMIKNPYVLKTIQKNASLSIIYRKDNIQNRSGFSTKLGEMLINEVPVITTSVGDSKLYLKNNESAYFIDEVNYKVLSEKIIQAFNNNEERTNIGKNGKSIAIKQFDPIYQGQILTKFYQSLQNV